MTCGVNTLQGVDLIKTKQVADNGLLTCNVFCFSKQTSGAQLDDEVKDIFQEVKVVKNDDDHMERARLVVFGFKNDTIVVETIYRGSDLKDKDVFLSFKELLEPTKCHYILYDCHFKTTDSAKAELVFVLW